MKNQFSSEVWEALSCQKLFFPLKSDVRSILLIFLTSNSILYSKDRKFLKAKQFSTWISLIQFTKDYLEMQAKLLQRNKLLTSFHLRQVCFKRFIYFHYFYYWDRFLKETAWLFAYGFVLENKKHKNTSRLVCYLFSI